MQTQAQSSGSHVTRRDCIRPSPRPLCLSRAQPMRPAQSHQRVDQHLARDSATNGRSLQLAPPAPCCLRPTPHIVHIVKATDHHPCNKCSVEPDQQMSSVEQWMPGQPSPNLGDQMCTAAPSTTTSKHTCGRLWPAVARSLTATIGTEKVTGHSKGCGRKALTV